MKELAKKLVLAVKAIDAVEKRGRNTNQQYDYVRATDVAREVRKVLVEQGISFSYNTLRTERWEKVSVDHKVTYYVELHVEVGFTDTESGESLVCNGVGWGMDNGDKAIYKAMTGALKYALRMNFLIPDELDPENDSHDAAKQVVRASSGPQSEEPPAEAYDDYPTGQNQPRRANGNGHASGKNDAEGDNAISIGKAKRFKAIAMASGKSWDDIEYAVNQAGLSDIRFCPWRGKTYENLCAWAEK